MPSRDLKVSIDGDASGFDAACTQAEAKARGLDRELANLERQQAAQEKVTARTTAAVREFAASEDRAGLAARKMGLEVEQAAQKAEKAQIRADAAAKAYEKGLISEATAAKAAAAAETALERAAIKAAEGQRAAARAADEQAQKERQVARDAELAGAAQRLAAYKASGSVKEHNAALKSLEARFGDLGKEGNGAFKEMEASGSKAFGAISNTGVGTIALVTAAIMAVPFAALGAEVAITGGIGGALAGLGLMATKSDANVQAALGQMTSHVKTETKAMAAPFKATWMAIAQEGTKTFDALAPELSRDFAKLAPVITAFVHDAGYAATLLGPSFGVATDAADKLFAALGGKLPEITRSVGSAIEIMAKSAGNNADEFANIASAIAGLLPPLAHLLDYAVKIGPYMSPLFGMMAKGGASVSALHDGFVKLSGGLISTDHSLKIAGGTFPSFSQQATVAAAKAGQLMTAEQAAALGADQLKTALDGLTGKTLNQREALIAYRQAITAMTQSLKDNGNAHGFATAKGAANEQALDKVASSAQAAAEAMKAAGKDPAPFLDAARQKIVAMAEKMHYSAAQANDLANKLLGIKPVTLSMDDADFMAKLHKAQGLTIDPKTGLLLGNGSDYLNKWLKAKSLTLNPKTGLFRGNNADYYNKWLKANGLHIDTKTGQIKGNTSSFWSAVNGIPSVVGHRQINVSYVPVNSANQPGTTRHAMGGYIGYAHGGNVARMAGGGPSGPVVGPGSGTSDDIPVWLSNGEYVIRATQAEKHRALLDSINNGANGFATGGAVGYATGGVATTPLDLGAVMQYWTAAAAPATKAQVDSALKSRRNATNALKSAEDALYKARHARHPDQRRIAADERRVTADRQNLASATAKLNDVENRYRFAKLTPVQQLDVALGLGIKDNAAFIKNLQTLADRGFGDLANKLLAMGGPEAEKIAVSAVKLNTSKLGSLQGKINQEQQQQDYLANLPNILTVRSTLSKTKGGISSWVALLNATGLDPASLSTAVKLMTADLSKTSSGKALIADMHAHGYVRGGTIVGPAGVDRVPMWGTAGEYVVNRQAAAANRPLLDALNYSTARVPVASVPVRGGDGASAGPQISQTFQTQDMDTHQLARESAREIAWQLR